MKVLWAPWRMKYIGEPQPEGCIFCDKPKQNRDPENLILLRSEHSFVIMNTFPYSNGHLMVIPRRHVASLTGLSPEELSDLMQTTQRCEWLVRRALSAEGLNIGINLGRCAGAGIDQHLHVHIVPRWTSDTNFMPVLGETKVMPELLEETYRKLTEEIERQKQGDAFR